MKNLSHFLFVALLGSLFILFIINFSSVNAMSFDDFLTYWRSARKDYYLGGVLQHAKQFI